MVSLAPTTAAEFAAALADAARRERPIQVTGNNSKALMGGPLPTAGTTLSTAGLRQILKYEPNDLTVSVEAGMLFAQLQSHLRARGQMIALDPPFSSTATVGGVVSTNSSGPLRCAFGTARDQIIGMAFAMLDGKLVTSGGMVVKNVAGLDMGKMLIGSFGTLAVMTSLNFRLHPRPEGTRTFLAEFSDLNAALAAREQIKAGPLHPLSFELLTPAAAARFEKRGYVLALLAGGSAAVLARYARELPGLWALPAEGEASFWRQLRSFTEDFLRRQAGGIVLRISTPLQDSAKLLSMISGPCLVHAASGVAYVYLSAWQSVPPFWRAAAEHGWSARVDFAPNEIRERQDLWLLSDEEPRRNSFAIMRKVKEMFDPQNLLNPLRLYGRI